MNKNAKSKWIEIIKFKASKVAAKSADEKWQNTKIWVFEGTMIEKAVFIGRDFFDDVFFAQ